MRTPSNYPVAIATSFLSIILVAGFAYGPAVNFDEVNRWQPLIASVLALAAAGIAYHGTTAKVRYDREVLKAEIERRRLSLYLKLEMALRAIHEETRTVSCFSPFPPLDNDQIFTRNDFKIAEPPELEEAWSYLDLFPRDAIGEIRRARLCLKSLAVLYQKAGDQKFVWKLGKDQPPYPISEAIVYISDLSDAAFIITEELEPYIRKMAPDLHENERFIRLYGDPVEFDDGLFEDKG